LWGRVRAKPGETDRPLPFFQGAFHLSVQAEGPRRPCSSQIEQEMVATPA
jgi:hypothetical protein